MDPSRIVFDSGVVRRACPGDGAHMLLFGGSSFFQGVSTAVLGMKDSRSSAVGGKRPFFTTHEELLEEEYYNE